MSKTSRKFCSKQKKFQNKLVDSKRCRRRGCIKTFVGHKKDFKIVSFYVDGLKQMEDEKEFAFQQQIKQWLIDDKHERIEKIFDNMLTSVVKQMLFG